LLVILLVYFIFAGIAHKKISSYKVEIKTPPYGWIFLQLKYDVDFNMLNKPYSFT